jgi:predicted transcriptional regulator
LTHFSSAKTLTALVVIVFFQYNASYYNALLMVKCVNTTSFRLDDDLEDKLEATATKLKRTKGWIINEALRRYIEREEQKLRMLEETEEAIADIRAQRIVSGEEVMEWLSTWGTASEGKAPKV